MAEDLRLNAEKIMSVDICTVPSVSPSLGVVGFPTRGCPAGREAQTPLISGSYVAARRRHPLMMLICAFCDLDFVPPP